MQQLFLPAAVAPQPSPAAAWASAHRSAAGSTHVLQRMLDIVDYGMLLILPGGEVAFANQVARLDLDDHPLLQLQGRALRVRLPADTAALRDALAAALYKGLQKMLTLGDRGTGSLSIAIVPVLDDDTAQPAAALLVLGKRQVCDELSVEAFARNHRLTPAELRVFKLLCGEHRPSQIASLQGVALSTVRSQVASVLEKTGAASIGTLLREVARLPPMPSLMRAAAQTPSTLGGMTRPARLAA